MRKKHNNEHLLSVGAYKGVIQTILISSVSSLYIFLHSRTKKLNHTAAYFAWQNRTLAWKQWFRSCGQAVTGNLQDEAAVQAKDLWKWWDQLTSLIIVVWCRCGSRTEDLKSDEWNSLALLGPGDTPFSGVRGGWGPWEAGWRIQTFWDLRLIVTMEVRYREPQYIATSNVKHWAGCSWLQNLIYEVIQMHKPSLVHHTVQRPMFRFRGSKSM